jgi:hypothetical protein
MNVAKLPIERGGIEKNVRGLMKAIELDQRFKSFRKFIVCMDGRLPFDGIQSEQEAQEYLQKEILRLRQSGNWILPPQKSSEILPEEWEEIRIRKHYDDNIVVKVVSDFLRSCPSQP